MKFVAAPILLGYLKRTKFIGSMRAIAATNPAILPDSFGFYLIQKETLDSC